MTTEEAAPFDGAWMEPGAIETTALAISAEARLAAATDSEEFLALAVHELRGPASVLTGLAETLEHLVPAEQLGPAASEALSAMVRTGRQFRRLVVDLLQSAYLERGDLALVVAPVALGDVIGWAVDAAGGRGDVAVDCDPRTRAMVDGERLQQILTNLVANALAHGIAPVTVAAVASAAVVTISVADAGAGVSPVDAEHLFDRFGGLSTRSSKSTGLGLSIARRLAVAMGGALVYRRTAAGSTFVLTLPACVPHTGLERS